MAALTCGVKSLASKPRLPRSSRGSTAWPALGLPSLITCPVPVGSMWCDMISAVLRTETHNRHAVDSRVITVDGITLTGATMLNNRRNAANCFVE